MSRGSGSSLAGGGEVEVRTPNNDVKGGCGLGCME